MPEGFSESSELCRSCGLCCDGTLFDYVPVADAEMARLAKLGFAVRQAKGGEGRYDHPCPKFCGECSIYEDRPASCASFQCELLRSSESGELSFTEARDIVRQAKGMIADIERRFGPQAARILPMEWTRLFEKWQSTAAPLREEGDSRLMLEQVRLQRFLDIHFRPAEQRKAISEK
jgi:uncharacterized protein